MKNRLASLLLNALLVIIGASATTLAATSPNSFVTPQTPREVVVQIVATDGTSLKQFFAGGGN